MKNLKPKAGTCFIVVPLLFASVPAFAQNYSIDWHTIDGGGGTSTGGVYSVSGTIGHPDAGTMTGGTFTLQGGFWALPQAVQVTNAPILNIAMAGPGQALISWAPDAGGWVLQQSLRLSPASWDDAPSGSTNNVIVSATLPARFYRLFRP